jgi:hypothetical protein
MQRHKEKEMIVTAGFYIGERSYLMDVAVDKSSYATQVEAAFDAATELSEEDTYLSLDPKIVSATLTFEGETYQAFQFVKSLVTADDEEGLPVLLYIDAHFSIDDSVDFDELESESSVVLQIGTDTISFHGVLEEL